MTGSYRLITKLSISIEFSNQLQYGDYVSFSPIGSELSISIEFSNQLQCEEFGEVCDAFLISISIEFSNQLQSDAINWVFILPPHFNLYRVFKSIAML